MIKAAIFDLNGIFIKSPKLSDRFAVDFGISTDVFLPKLSEIMGKVRQPDAGPAFSYWEPTLREWGVQLSEQDFWDYWFTAETVAEDMVAYARELRARGILVILLSNNFKERADYYGHYPWINDAVDAAYFSWQTGFVKPDPQAWTHILEMHGLTPEECVYFDDQEKNIRAAEGVGMRAYLATDVNEIRAAIEK